MLRFAFAALSVLVAASAADAQIYRGGFRSGQVRVGPLGGIAASQNRGLIQATPLGTGALRANRFTQVLPNGTVVQAGRLSGVRVGPLGATGGSVSGVRVTGPTGVTQTTTYRRSGFILR